jgi:hypothetical protein
MESPSDAVTILRKIEKAVNHKSKVEQLWANLETQLGGCYQRVVELQAALRAEFHSKRMWSNAEAPQSVEVRALIERCSHLLEALRPDPQRQIIIPPTYAPGNSPFRVSTKLDSTKNSVEREVTT